MPIVFAFCRTAASVRFIAFATSTTGVFTFGWALSCRRWHSRQWHMETRTGSPWHVSRRCPQLHAASWFVIRLVLCLKSREGERACSATCRALRPALSKRETRHGQEDRYRRAEPGSGHALSAAVRRTLSATRAHTP